MLKIYIATPYSHPDQSIRQARYEAVTDYAAMLFNLGCNPFSPITHSHPMAERNKLKGDWEAWKEVDRQHIEWADEVYVFCQDGWENSKGVRAEIEIARTLGKPINFVSPDGQPIVAMVLQELFSFPLLEKKA